MNENVQASAPASAFDVVNIFKAVHEEVPEEYVILVFDAAMKVYYRERFNESYAQNAVVEALEGPPPSPFGDIE